MKFSEDFLQEHYVKQGKSFQKIAKENGVSKKSVTYWAKKYNIKSHEKQVLKNIIGQRFGKLVVKHRVENPGHGGAKWFCQCDCGETKEVVRNSLIGGLTKSCGCDRRNRLWKGYEKLSSSYWNSIISGAKSRNLEFSITMEDAWNQFIRQNKKCALSGVDIVIIPDYPKASKKHTASLDRIDNKKGYTKENIQWVYRDLNMLRRAMPIEVFLDWVKRIYEFNFIETNSKID